MVDDQEPNRSSSEFFAENILSDEAQRNLAKALSKPIVDIQTKQLAQIRDAFLPSVERMVEMLEPLQEHVQEIRKAVEETVELDDPWDYDPEASTVNSRARKTVTEFGADFIDAIHELDDPYFGPLAGRMSVAYGAYVGYVENRDGEWIAVNPRVYESIYLFISLQDALMHWLCEQSDRSPDDYAGDGSPIYHGRSKKEVLKEEYISLYGMVDKEQFSDNLESFYQHRNFIMHGSPQAHFDMNIATASFLFFILTLHTVLESIE